MKMDSAIGKNKIAWQKTAFILIIALATCALAFHGTVKLVAASAPQANSNPSNENTSRNNTAAAAFTAIVPVLHHPRCMNCHSTGDFPRQGDDGHRHTMNVRRGIEGQGVPGLK